MSANREVDRDGWRDVVIGFGALPPLPDGYEVVWHESDDHYHAEGPDGWLSVCTVNKWQARRWCFQHAEEDR